MSNSIKVFAPVEKPLTKNHPVRNGIITITEKLEPGDYEFGLFENISKKGYKYLRGNIRPVYKKEPVQSFQERKEEVESDSEMNDDFPYQIY